MKLFKRFLLLSIQSHDLIQVCFLTIYSNLIFLQCLFLVRIDSSEPKKDDQADSAALKFEKKDTETKQDPDGKTVTKEEVKTEEDSDGKNATKQVSSETTETF